MRMHEKHGRVTIIKRMGKSKQKMLHIVENPEKFRCVVKKNPMRQMLMAAEPSKSALGEGVGREDQYTSETAPS